MVQRYAWRSTSSHLQLSAFIGSDRTEVGARFDPRDGGNC